MRFVFAVTTVMGLVAGGAAADPAFGRTVLEPFLGNLRRPVHAVFPPGSSGHVYVVEQRGRLLAVRGSKRAVMLDLTGRTNRASEEGLLSVALAPGYGDDRTGLRGSNLIFVSYTTGRPSHSVVSSWRLDYRAGAPVVRAGSERVILRVRQPYSNHNGGHILFGPDGHLYFGLGDGGSAGDPQGHGQNPRSLLGKILRLAPRPAGGYDVPRDNPFRRRPPHRPETFALGLRNPWRLSFDRQTGRLYAGDVGQNRQEEINMIRAGGNYGWNRMEGTLCYRPSQGCRKPEFVLPLHVYGRAAGSSVTGGYVYRGRENPALRGHYVFGDYVSGRIWALPLTDRGEAAGPVRLLTSAGGTISSFAEDQNGELYVVQHQEGRIVKIVQK